MKSPVSVSLLLAGTRGALFRALFLALACGVAGCDDTDEQYKPAPKWTGKMPNLPTPPPITLGKIKDGDAYTVQGAAHHLRSRIHDVEVTKNPVTIVGYIVAENIGDAPKCAIHKVGTKDPDDCPPAGTRIEIPSFWIADEKGAGPDKPRIRVLGWAKNWATVYEAMQKYTPLKDPPKELYKDDQWNTDVPFPLPAVGAKVKVTGNYGFAFTKATTGIVTDPVNGVMTYDKMETLEPAPEKAAFKNK